MYAQSGSVRRIRTLIVTGSFAWAILTNDPINAAPNHLASEQQVLTFIADTIDWYRHLPTARQIGTEPVALLFLEDNRSVTTEIVRLSFEFGKAVAAIDPGENSSNPPSTPGPPAANSELKYLIAPKAKLDANTQQAEDQLKSVTQAKLTARGTDRKKLDTEVAEIRSRIQLLKAMSANYQILLGFVRTASTDPDRATNMAALVENLERTVPDISAAVSPSQTSNFPADPLPSPYGIMGMIFRVSTLARKERVIDGVIERTAALTKSLQNVRTPFAEPFRKRFSTFSLDVTSLDVLQRQESRLTGLVAEAKTLSPAIAALIRQQTLLNLYRTHLIEWRSEINNEYRTAWITLLVRMAVLGAAAAILLGISMVVRRLMHRHVHQLDTRQMLLIGERVLLWLIIVTLVLFAFAFDLSSLATFFGLLFAGLAVGLHDVFLAIAGYMLIVGKIHMRAGDRVQISGVTGEVRNLGLLQFELSEIDPATGQQTGRVVFLSNSYVFLSPATPLFRQVSGRREIVTWTKGN